MNRFIKRYPWLLMAASACLFYGPLTARVLWDSDEGRYAEIAREMLELKDWITPHLNYGVYFEKPPLLYWLTALSMSVFGINAFAARFWCAAFGVLTVGVTYLIGRHWKSQRCGFLAGGILATSLLFFVLTQFLVLDMALTFWMTLALYALSRLVQEASPKKMSGFATLLAVAFAGGLLTKGLVAIILPTAVALLSVFYSRLVPRFRQMPWQGALGLFLLLSTPWFVAVSLKNPYFPSFFFIHEHFARYLTSVHHRTAPMYFFFPILLAGFLPWTVFLPRVWKVWISRRGTALKRDPVAALLVIWSAFIFFFFSISKSKLVPYILPVFPAFALLTAAAFEDVIDQESLPSWVEKGTKVFVGILAVALCVIRWPLGIAELNKVPASWAVAQSGWLGIVLALGIFILIGMCSMRKVGLVLAGLFLVQGLLWTSVASLASSLDPYYSAQVLGEHLRLRLQPGERLVAYGVSYENQLQTLLFYARQRIAVFGDPGELTLGMEHDPEASQWFAPESGMDSAIRDTSRGTWVVTNEEYWSRLGSLGLQPSFQPVLTHGRLRLLRRL